MHTGTDISLQECRASGYAVVKHGKRPLDVDKRYSLTISDARFWPYGNLKIGTPRSKAYAVDTSISYRDLWESFERGGAGIKSFCDFENCPFPSPDEAPSFHDFVSLASIVNMYHGID